MAALKLAMQKACKDKSRKQQLESMLEDRSWHEVAEFAADCCQHKNLQLKPWEVGSLDVDEDEQLSNESFDARKQAQRLLRRMLKAGVSRYHPDPMAALDRRRRPVRFWG